MDTVPEDHVLPPVVTRRADALAIGRELADELAATAVSRDAEGTAPFDEVRRLRATGLLPAAVPASLGGGGLDWPTIFEAMRPVARVDAGLGHVFTYHFLQSWRIQLNEETARIEALQRRSAERHWFWGGAGNPRDASLELTPVDGGFTVRGRKFFATGAQVSDRIVASATRTDDGEKYAIVIDAHLPEVVHHDDWDNIGQRLSASGSVSFEDAFVPHAHVLGPGEQTGPRYRPYASLSGLSFQLALAHLQVAIAEGALAVAADYVRTGTRPWGTSGVDRAVDDPYIRELIGQLASATRASDALVWRATDLFAAAEDKGWDLGDDERGELSIELSAAKVETSRVALDVSSRVFDLTGARATASRYGFDRFWRNARTLTLHDPAVYKAREVGDRLLTGEFPEPSGYS